MKPTFTKHDVEKLRRAGVDDEEVVHMMGGGQSQPYVSFYTDLANRLDRFLQEYFADAGQQG